MNAASQAVQLTKQATEAGPFLKWAGGKGQLLEQLSKHFPDKFGRYFEPCLGSAAVFFHLIREHGQFPATLIDTNEELINCFEVVRANLNDLIPRLRDHEKRHGETHYYDTRSQTPSELSEIERAARFIYLNKTCYNGLYRVNSRGHFNVPIGSYQKPRIFDEENIVAVSKALKGVTLYADHFSRVLKLARADDFIYFDPPYYTESNGFTSYAVSDSGRASFGAYDHQMLRNVVGELVAKGCRVVLSNSDTPYIRSIYKGFAQYAVEARRFINCNGAGRQHVTELVIVGK
jgi:DNA adenine methylase